MAAMSPKEQRDAFASSMIAEGLLDQQFNQLLMLEEDGSGFLVEVIKLFCDDSERMMSELINLLDQDDVDYQKVDSFVHQLKGSSSRASGVERRSPPPNIAKQTMTAATTSRP